MAQRDTIDFVGAFLVGAILGAGVALLLRPERPSRAERILRELEPYRRKLGRRPRRARRWGARRDRAGGLMDAGRELLRELREEMAAAIAQARDELAEAAGQEVERALKRGGLRPAKS